MVRGVWQNRPMRVLLAFCAVAIVVGSFVEGAITGALYVASVILFPAALIVQAAPRARWVAAALASLLGACAAALLLVWPASLALMLLGMGLGPLLLVSCGYAATFESDDPPPAG